MLADEGSPTSAGGGDNSWQPGEFEAVCLGILEKLWPMFGKSIIYFDHPVETNVVPDYYTVSLTELLQHAVHLTLRSPPDRPLAVLIEI